MKALMRLSLLLFFTVSAYVSTLSVPQVYPPAVLDLQEFIGSVEDGFPEDVSFEESAVGHEGFLFSDSAPAPLVSGSGFSFIRTLSLKVFSYFSLLSAALPQTHSVPVGFIVWLSHLGWYP